MVVSSIYFTTEELEYLRGLVDKPSHAAIWDSVTSWCNARINDPVPAEPVGGSWSDYFDVAKQVRRFIETMGFMYAMTEDSLYAEPAKDWMLSVAAWSDWNNSPPSNDWQVPCEMAIGMAFGYDVLRDYMTPSENEVVRNALISHMEHIYTTYHSGGYEWSLLHGGYPNKAAVISGGIGLTALAIADDYPAASNWLNFAILVAESVLSKLGQDGGYVEGVLYCLYGFDTLVPFLDALERRTGQDLFSPSLGQLPYYLIYFDYNGRPLVFEDRDWYSWNADYVPFVYRLAAQYNNGYGQWFADTYADQSYMQSYIWKDPDLLPTPPTDLPLTKHFRDYGYVIFRTGWGANDLLFAFKSGSSMGHAHPSQNEFGIYYQGKPITCGPGNVCMMPEDDTWSHNCLLVDGKGQGQEPGDYETLPMGTRGVIQQVDVNDPYYRYVRGDASAVYTGTNDIGKLNKWLRHVVFIETPNYFVIYDDVAADTAKRFDWLLQGPKAESSKGTFSVSGDLITLTKNGQKLRVMVVEPEGFIYEIITESSFTNYIKVSPPLDSPSAQFLTVLFPNAVRSVGEVKVGNAIGITVTYNNKMDLILFSSDGNPVNQYVELGGYYEAIDDGGYEFSETRVRTQFETYQVMRLQEVGAPRPTPTWLLPAAIIGIISVAALMKRRKT